MAKPRVFISSTYYDLRYVRSTIEEFVRNSGYESILFEKGDIPFHHTQLLEQSCLNEVDLADIFVLILGGRYGSLSSEDSEELASDPDKFFARIRSITQKEYERARVRSIPIYIFVESSVLSEYRTFQKNRTNLDINYAHVDDIRVFQLIDDIYAQRLNNLVKNFDRAEEIISWLRDQWAGIFCESLRSRSKSNDLANFGIQLTHLNSVVNTLQSYVEKIIRTEDEHAEDTILFEKLKQVDNIADAIIDENPIQWFIGHDETKMHFDVSTQANKNKILENIMLCDGPIEFLTEMGVVGEPAMFATMGVEQLVFTEFARLKRAIKNLGLDTSAILSAAEPPAPTVATPKPKPVLRKPKAKQKA